ncbi:type II toxin-antitoxin system VapC family toxin [Thiohalorhabdus methylotrophus]|uniref:Type II toxin-antitoxin system VapC family toxin n=1 Tax=Thiohalorhabdus methylotrophus TaxID=3242694 RepID=A0ABV4TT82_9GAMM
MERLLLDTHAFPWWLADDPRLGEGARARIAEPANPVYVSAATGWEIGIKKALGKLQAPDDLDAAVAEEGFTHLPITFFHGEQAGALPAHHRDPFDRMLVAQAQAEGLVVVTRDPQSKAYGIRTVNAEA